MPRPERVDVSIATNDDGLARSGGRVRVRARASTTSVLYEPWAGSSGSHVGRASWGLMPRTTFWRHRKAALGGTPPSGSPCREGTPFLLPIPALLTFVWVTLSGFRSLGLGLWSWGPGPSPPPPPPPPPHTHRPPKLATLGAGRDRRRGRRGCGACEPTVRGVENLQQDACRALLAILHPCKGRWARTGLGGTHRNVRSAPIPQDSPKGRLGPVPGRSEAKGSLLVCGGQPNCRSRPPTGNWPLPPRFTHTKA
jgi:hypothetical protein